MAWLKTILSWFVGGTLDRVLDTLDNTVDNETTRQQIKAEMVAEFLRAQLSLLSQRTWWFQLFFVVPLGFWFSAVVIDSVFQFDWNVAALPAPLDQWAGWIISSLFLIDGGKVLLAGLRGRR